MQKNEEKGEKASGFDGLGIDSRILSILTKNGITEPTLIQRKSIPPAIKGHDLMGVAQTGTGKTFAFGIPLIQNILSSRGRALVLLPTRELANQVEENLKKIAWGLGIKTISIIGGEAFNRQLFSLKRNPNIIVATPGRLLDHLRRKTIRLDDISFLVLDEADMMFDMGFAPQIEELIKLTPKTRQTLLFSATMPAAIIKLAEKYLKTPLQIQVAPSGSTVDLIDQEIYLIRSEEKFKNLIKILGDYRKLVLIFVRTRYGASSLCKRLNDNGYRSVEIHSNLSFNQRKKSLQDFKDASSRIMVATDVAARGLDINDIQLVLNYDLPDNSEDYVHRIGRTARAGKGGKAITFSLSNQIRQIQKIERLIKKNLPIRRMGSDEVLINRANKKGGNNSNNSGSRGGGNSVRSNSNNRGNNKKFFTRKPKGRSGNFNRRRG